MGDVARLPEAPQQDARLDLVAASSRTVSLISVSITPGATHSR